MLNVALHLMTLVSQLDLSNLDVLNTVKEMGFDGIELPMVNPMGMSADFIQNLRKELDRLNLACLCSAGLGRDENLVDPNPAIRESGKQVLKRMVDIAGDLGSHSIAGVLYGTFEMSLGRGRTEEEWNMAVDLLGEAAVYAQQKEVDLCVEVINRYETYFLNTARDAVALVEAIGQENVKVHLDTYHMNIEEKDFYEAIVACKGHLGHLHCSENDRGTPGTGHVDWDGVFRALKEIDYAGWLGIEGFHEPIPFIPIASSVWRKLAATKEEIPQEGLIFLRKKMEEHGL